jgi:hypothetical protein
MLGDAGSIPSTAEWLVDMGFLLGFVHPQLDGYDAAQITSMTRDFAHFFARAVQFSKEDNN